MSKDARRNDVIGPEHGMLSLCLRTKEIAMTATFLHRRVGPPQSTEPIPSLAFDNESTIYAFVCSVIWRLKPHIQCPP